MKLPNPDIKMLKIFELCMKKKNIYHISKEIDMAYKNTLVRLKKYESLGLLKKEKVPNIRGVQTLYNLTPAGKRALKMIKPIEKEMKLIAAFGFPGFK